MKHFFRCALSVSLVALGRAAPAQAQDDVDIYLADVVIGPTSVTISSPRNATDRPGYDNQPWFTPDGASFLYASFVGDQSDIFRYDLAAGTATRITDTPWHELSPSTFNGNGEILVMGGGEDRDTRGLWRYSPSGEPLGPFLQPPLRVAYYGVANHETVIGWLNDGNGTLVWADGRDGTVVPLRDRVAPSPPQKIPGQWAMSFVEPDFVGQMWIKRLDLVTRSIAPIVPAVGDGWFYAWMPDGRILMADGDAIFVWSPDGPEGWQEVARFPGIGTISRIVLSPLGTHVAFTVAPPEG